MRFLLIALLLGNTVRAQHFLRNDYSIHDPCPDPKKNHIASRTIYTDQVGDQQKVIRTDTLFEKYDRNGNLLSINYFEAGIGPEVPYWIKHEFSYDEKQRLIREETQFTGDGWQITYKYNEKGDTVQAHYTPSHETDEIVFTTVIYSKNGDTTQYDLNRHGDTVRYIHATKTGMTNISWGITGNLNWVGTDSTVKKCYSDKIEITTWYIDREEKTASREEIFLLDKKGRVVDELVYINNHVLSDSIHHEYDKRGRRILTTSTIYPSNGNSPDTSIARWETKYLYNKEGKLVQTHETILSRPNLRFVVSYIYNERGLLTEIHKVDLSNGHITKEERQWWVYTYY